MWMDRIIAAAFVVLVSTAIVGSSTGSTGASFTGTTTNPSQILNTQSVTPPASFTSAASAIAGRIDLDWTATTSAAGSHTLTYLVLRGPVGGPYSQVGTTAGLSHSDTPAADGTYEYVVQTKIAQGAGFFTSGNSATRSAKSDRTAPTMSVTCNGGSCAGWFSGNVSVVVNGNDGAGVGMGTATTNLDGAGAATSAAPRTITVSGQGAHSVVFSGADAAANASGNSTQTVNIDDTAPTPATGITGAAGQQNGEIDLTWTRGTDPLSGIASQTIHRTNAVAACPVVSVANYPNATVVAGTAAAATISGLAPNDYCFYITTTDSAGNGADSARSALITAN